MYIVFRAKDIESCDSCYQKFKLKEVDTFLNYLGKIETPWVLLRWFPQGKIMDTDSNKKYCPFTWAICDYGRGHIGISINYSNSFCHIKNNIKKSILEEMIKLWQVIKKSTGVH